MIVFSTIEYHYMLAEMLNINPSLEIGKVETKIFPDGETYHRLLTNVLNKKVVIIGATVSDSNTLELLDLAEGCVQNGAECIHLVVPYFAYSTMERAVKSGEIVKAKSRARLLSSISAAQQNTNIYLMDLHSEGIPYYFENNVRAHHIYCKPIIIKAIQQLGGNDFVLAATDAGRAKWVESLAEELKVTAAFVYKNRSSGSTTTVTGINADVQDKTVVIYDDMIRTGGSLMQAAQQYHNKGAKQIFVVSTHGLFTNNALQKIEEQGLIQKIICTNTHCNAQSIKNSLLEVHSVTSLIHQLFV
jgi:ribose-phosphate pyrophosphokinase